ncbi:MAG: metallophosphoesterase [Candidatus Hydrogenedentes bacterium]|nr:metallophosphoesterase [Candidatus Hydrogenedentota bacterium]
MKTPINLIHITDLHFFSYGLAPSHFLSKRILGYVNWVLNRSKRFDFSSKDKFLAYLRNAKPKGVIISGDFTVTSDDREFELARRFTDEIKSLSIPVYIIPGNHDYYTFESVRRKRFEFFFKDYLISEEYPYSVRIDDNLTVIFLHTVRPNFLSSRGVISKEQVEKLGEMIATNKTPVIVCGHYPILHKTDTYYSNATRRLKGARFLRKVIVQAQTSLLYIAGHVHHYSYTVDRDNSRVSYLTTPPLFYRKDKEGGFCEITLCGEDFKIKFHLLPEL